MPLPYRIPLTAFFLVGHFWFSSYGTRREQLLFLCCFVGAVFGRGLWKHHRRREIEARFITSKVDVAALWTTTVVCALTIAWLVGNPDILNY